LLDPKGTLTLPVWVDHVGMAGTKYAVGTLAAVPVAPAVESLPQIQNMDDPDPARWRKVCNIICWAGERVQLLAVQRRLENSDVECPRWRLARGMAPEDSLLVVGLHATCSSNVIDATR
jgi:hypothetical protein